MICIDDYIYKQIKVILENKLDYFDKNYNNNQNKDSDEKIIYKSFEFEEVIELKKLFIELTYPRLKKNFKICLNFQDDSSEQKITWSIFYVKWCKVIDEINKYIYYLDSNDIKQLLWFHIIGCPDKIKTQNQFVLIVSEIIYSISDKSVESAIKNLVDNGFSDLLSEFICDLLYDNPNIYTFEESLKKIAEPID